MSTNNTTLFARVLGVIAGLAALTILVLIAYAVDNHSFAKGLTIGGSGMIIAMIILWSRANKGGAAARIASGISDERESALFRSATVDAAAGMFLAATGSSIWALFGAPAQGVAAVVLWTGFLTLLVSFAIRAKRG